MRRRALLAAGLGLGAGSVAARAQERLRRVGVLIAGREDDPEAQIRIDGLRAGLKELGWIEGRTVALTVRFGGGDAQLIKKHVDELVAMAPDLIVANSGAALDEVHKATGTIPVIFMLAVEPVGLGYIDSLSRPGHNITGFLYWDSSLIGKWLQLLKDAAPATQRVAVLYQPDASPFYPRLIEIAQAMPELPPVTLSLTPVRDAGEIERVVRTVAQTPNSALLAPSDPFIVTRRDQFAAAAIAARLPLLSIFRDYAPAGALMTYGPDIADIFRRTATYVDRILKGANPGLLPAQAPTRYEFVINAGTAHKLGLVIPPTTLALADEVIE